MSFKVLTRGILTGWELMVGGIKVTKCVPSVQLILPLINFQWRTKCSSFAIVVLFYCVWLSSINKELHCVSLYMDMVLY